MSIDYSAVLGVGCYYEDLELSSLTDEAREMFIEHCKEYNDDEDFDYGNSDILQECWDDSSLKHEFLFGELDLVVIEGNAFTGVTDKIGFDVKLDIENFKDNVDEATLKFQRYFNIKPELMLGVSVW